MLKTAELHHYRNQLALFQITGLYNYNVPSSTHSTSCCHVSLELLHAFISVYVSILLKKHGFQFIFSRNSFMVNADAGM